MRSIIKTLAAAASLMLTALTALLLKLVVERAGLPYANGRYFDATDSVVYDEGAVVVYALLAAIFALVTAAAIWGTARLWKRN